MTDIVDRATRSRMMSGIRGRDTKPEIIVRKYLHAAGLRFRVAPKNLPGKPDIVLSKYRTVVLVHGCFWHRHKDCRYAAIPATRAGFWQKKFEANVERDERTNEQLADLGWRVIVIWECELTTGKLQSLVTDIRFNIQHPSGT
ncbi:very short patch repair endonuclease [Rhodanobacter sp. C03]|uniref:very short patch repair endonuclease n=1 Tax=Rhodanobacter sp. C03 TaxID=1945858 RepID=UPI000987AFF6|nr:very short patch repair endonuclease [Rhodanobacter sp. C03]OOG58372.1 very short patch repair endonuclease [Rhodanobacter sp. C03]